MGFLILALCIVAAVLVASAARMADAAEAPKAPALRKDGTPRKKREAKDIATRIREEAEARAKREANLAWDVAKAVLLAAGAGFQNIIDGRNLLMRFNREAEVLTDEAKVAERIRRLEERKVRLLERSAIAKVYRPKAEKAIAKVEATLVAIGERFKAGIAAGTMPTAEEAQVTIREMLPADDLLLLANPDDPFHAYRRAKRAPETTDAVPAGAGEAPETLPDIDDDFADDDEADDLTDEADAE